MKDRRLGAGPGALLAWLAFAPLLLFPGWSPVGAAVAAGALLILLLRGRYCQDAAAVPFTPFLVVYLFLAAVSFVAGPLPGESVRRLTTLLAGTGGYLILLRWLRQAPERLHQATIALGLGGGLLAFAAPFFLKWPERYLVNIRPIVDWLSNLAGSFTVHHNSMAAALLLLLPLALGGGARQRGWRGYLLWLAAILMVLLLFLTQSRNAFLALIAALVTAGFWGRVPVRYFLFVFLLLLVTPFLLSASSGPALESSVRDLDEVSKQGPAPVGSWQERLEYWSAAIEMMGDYPVIGAGLYAFGPVSRANYIYETISPRIEISHAHNLFLQAGSGLGWGGFVALAGMWASLAVALWRRGAHRDSLTVAMGAAVVAYLFFNSFDVFALEQRAGLLVWAFLALVATVLLESQAATAAPAPAPGRIAWLAMLPLALVLALAPALEENVARLQLDRARLAGSGRLPPADLLAGDARRLGLRYLLSGDEAAALQAWATDPGAVPFLIAQGKQAYGAGEARAGIRWCSLALHLDGEAAAAYFWRGEAYEELGTKSQALADYQRAVATAADETIYGISLAAAAWDGQGRLLLQREAWQAAADAFRAAAVLEPGVKRYSQQLEDVERILSQLEGEG